MFLVPWLSLVFDTMTGHCFERRAPWLKKKIQDFSQTLHTQGVCLLISYHLPCPRLLFTHGPRRGGTRLQTRCPHERRTRSPSLAGITQQL